MPTDPSLAPFAVVGFVLVGLLGACVVNGRRVLDAYGREAGARQVRGGGVTRRPLREPCAARPAGAPSPAA